ncbi:MAG: efflux transporter outer membrane subunit [Alphaproteobacteria bacterium]|nr:efflux transporter outer membrane subunit [Alphaproteobacteria bacterium]
MKFSVSTMLEKVGGRAAWAVLLMMVCGCAAVGPDFVPPDPLLPSSSFLGKPQPASEQTASENLRAKDPKWWVVFRDPILTSLIDRAAADNLDVQTAGVRLAESRSQRSVTAAAAFPVINGNASYQRELFSENGIVSLAKPLAPPNQPFLIPPISIWQTGFDASWEIDFWGRVRRQVEGAEAQVEASEDQRHDALVSTLAEVARNYIALRGTQREIAIAKANLASASDIWELTKTRAQKGLTTGLDVENAAAQVESIKATIPTLENDESSEINALSFLLDEPPGALRGELAKPKPIPPTPPKIPLGIPSELARRRPDIRQAEAQLHQATAAIGVSVADFYPSVTFNGNVEFNALDLKNLWKGSSLQYVIGPSISLPIFAGGRIRSTVELREAQQQEAAIAYHKTVLNAWHEVVNALVALRTEQSRRSRLKAETEHSAQALTLSRARYANGVGDFITVLDAERTELQAETQYAQSTTTVSTDLVQLYKALGGGWEAFPERSEPIAALPLPPLPAAIPFTP